MCWWYADTIIFASWWYAETILKKCVLNWSSQGVFRTSSCAGHPDTFFICPLDVSQKCYAKTEAVFYDSIDMFTYISICVPIVSSKKQRYGNAFLKICSKTTSWRRTGNVSLWTSLSNIFKRALRRSSEMLLVLRLVFLLVFWWMKIENKDVALPLS